MHEHQHEQCKHECLHYCPVCNKVYCCKCKQEWGNNWYRISDTITYPSTTTYHPETTWVNCGSHFH